MRQYENEKRRNVKILRAILMGLGIVILVIAAVYFIQDYMKNYKEQQIYQEAKNLLAEGEKATPTIPSTPMVTPLAATAKPTIEPTATVRAILSKFTELFAVNADLVGWLTVPDTVIDYPVLQGEDNEYYLHRDYEGNETTAGSIFMDYRCNIDDLQGHYILYGHHMKNGSMFKGLMAFKDQTFFNEHRTFQFSTLYEDMTWEVFSAYPTDVNDYYIETSFGDEEEYYQFITGLQEKSTFKTDIQLKPDDVVLTLSTCSYEVDDGRYVVHARLVKP